MKAACCSSAPTPPAFQTREDFKLNRPDAGGYQVRHALEAYCETSFTDFEDFRSAYAALSQKLHLKLYTRVHA